MCIEMEGGDFYFGWHPCFPAEEEGASYFTPGDTEAQRLSELFTITQLVSSGVGSSQARQSGSGVYVSCVCNCCACHGIGCLDLFQGPSPG